MRETVTSVTRSKSGYFIHGDAGLLPRGSEDPEMVSELNSSRPGVYFVG